jgi:hypothetical protein
MSTVYIVILTYIKPLEKSMQRYLLMLSGLKRGMQRGFSWRPVDGSQETVVSFSLSASLASLEELLREDPFQTLKLATVEIIPFEPSMKTELENVF